MLQAAISVKADTYGSECETPSPDERKEMLEYKISTNFYDGVQEMQKWPGLVALKR